MDAQDIQRQVARLARRSSELHDATQLPPKGTPVQSVIEELADGLAALSLIEQHLRSRESAMARLQREAAAERRRYRHLFAHAQAACLVTDASGIVTETNAAGAQLCGRSREALIGMVLADLVVEPDRCRFSALATERRTEHGGEAVVGLQRGPDDVATCLVRSFADGVRGGPPAGHVWIFEDLRLQQRALLADELMDDVRRRDEFLNLLSHELRDPLAPVRSAVELWREHADRLTSEQESWTMEVVGRQADHLAHVVDDLLDVSRLSHGKIRLECSTVDLREVIESAYDAVRSHAQLHRIAIATPPAPVLVHGDPVRLRQIAANLLDNALESTPRGGSITLRVGIEDDAAVIVVKDDGIGLQPDVLETIFGMYQHGARGLTASQSKLCLGLPLVRRLVELHGGSVTARSEGPGRGAEFVVRLRPLLGDECTPRAPTDSQMARLGPHELLLVDDNVDAAEMLAMLLEAAGHRVALAFDGAGAIGAYERTRPDAVLLDLGLPDMDGLQVAARLRSLDPTIPLVALTGHGDEAMRARTRSFGFAEHLLKPVEFDALRRVLFEVHRRAKQD